MPLDPIRWKFYPRIRVGKNVRAHEIISSLHPSGIVLERLLGRSGSSARENTLSYFHGHEEFPFHSDRAFADTPPRWLLLVAPRPRATQTKLLDTESLISIFGEAHLRRALFVQLSRNGRYCRFLTDVGNQQCIRYNPDVMRAVNSEAIAIEKYLQLTCDATIIDWKENYMTLVNNWSMLHARGPFIDKGKVSLFRFSIWSKIDGVDIN